MRGTRTYVFTLATFEQLSASPTTALLRITGTTTEWATEPTLAAERAGRTHRFGRLPGRPRPGRWAYSAPLALVRDPATRWTLELGEESFPLPPPSTGVQVERPRGHGRREGDRRDIGSAGELLAAREATAFAEEQTAELARELAGARERVAALERQTRKDAREIEELVRTIRGEASPTLRPIEPAAEEPNARAAAFRSRWPSRLPRSR